ncbi:MAG: 5'-3' exonuclease H3TH domain-containing protein [Planctomycetota bacterium]
MSIHLVDGTFELFRAYFGAPSAKSSKGQEVGATRGLLRSLLAMIRNESATHVACAFDQVIESFRNKLFKGYKTGEGVEPELLAQFPLAERAARALGFVVWPMVEFEADDALATAAHHYARRRNVEQVVICSPDKDLAQCVQGKRVICVDRLRQRSLDEDGVRERFGVSPGSIPDWLALVGDKADGIPGIPGWGRKSASTLLAYYETVAAIPDSEADWEVTVRGAARLAENLRTQRKEVELYRTLATLRRDVPIAETPQDLIWRGARRDELQAFCEELADPRFPSRIPKWRGP